MMRIKTLVFFTVSLLIAINVKSQEMTFAFKENYQSSFKRLENANSSLSRKQNIGFPKNLNSNISKFLPILFTAYGFIAIKSNPLKQINYMFQEEILEHHPLFRTHFDDYLQFYPTLTTFAFKLAGNSGRNNFRNSMRIYTISTLMMAGTVYTLKKTTGVLRPDGSDRNSFPSGHTATAFAGAEFLHQEFKNTTPIWSYTGYVAATATGALRMYNNKHYFSDVVAGAGIGILSTKAAYWLNEKLFAKKQQKSN